jgi:hypothetical protein
MFRRQWLCPSCLCPPPAPLTVTDMLAFRPGGGPAAEMELMCGAEPTRRAQ